MTGRRTVDFDLAGRVRIRVVGHDRDVAVVGKQLGLPYVKPAGDADITIEVVDKIERTGLRRFLGREEAGFSDDGFYVFRSKAKSRVTVRLPLQDIGNGLTLHCEPNFPAVPLLISLVAVTAIGKGLVPLHAGAFTWNDVGVVVAGWSKGGKTETILATTQAGAKYVGDEWCYIDPVARTVVGIPEPVTIWAWHLRHSPELRKQVARKTRARMAALDLPDRLEAALPMRVRNHKFGRLLRRIAYQTRDRANAWIDPASLFGAERAAVGFSHVVLVMSAECEQTVLHKTSASDIATRMASSVRYELEPLLQHYHMFRFAFPHLKSSALESLDADIEAAMHRALDPATAWVLEHPYPVDLADLATALKPLSIQRSN